MDFTGKVFGSYKLLRLIGQGGYADVYEAVHIWLGDHMAVKVLRIRVNPRDTQAVRKSLSEALIANRLKHPHIIPIIDCNVQNGIPYIVMPYMKNGSLHRVHARDVPLPLDTVIDYVRQVAETLTFVHSHHFIHQDVKPENMLLDDDGNILLSDFGTVGFIQSTGPHAPQELIGTVGFMSPERFTGDIQTPASDVYSLGIVVYKWLTGRFPFTGTASEIAFKHVHAPPATQPLHVQGIDPAIRRVLLKALAKNPRNRYQSAMEFYDALIAAKRVADQRQHMPQGRRTRPKQRLLGWVEMSIIVVISLFLSPLPSIILYIKGFQLGTDIPVWLVCLTFLLIVGGLIRKNRLALQFILADFAVAVMIGIFAQSLALFCFALPGLLIISAFIGLWKEGRA
jgi:serine/threonine protein kinase